RIARALQAAVGAGAAASPDAPLAAALLIELRNLRGGVSQRAALLGALLDELVSDPHLPATCSQALAGWTVPLFKAALADDSFFTNPAQPLRQLLSRETRAAVTARTESDAAVQQAQARLAALPESFDVSVAFVQPALQQRKPLAHEQVLAFQQQQAAESAERRAELLAKVRRVVTHALEGRILGRTLPAALDELLRIGVGPLLARCLLRDGYGSQPWEAELARVGLILDGAGNNDEFRRRGEALARLVMDLKQAGLSGEKAGALVQGLRDYYRQADEQAALMVPAIAAALDAPPPANDLLAQLLRPDQWFQVYDPQRSESCWMKVAAYAPAHDRVTFVDFSGQKTLTMRASEFAGDLKTRRSGPVGASAEVQQALARLMAA
ncbi:MAG TPA: DUF1631 family protein, partial [Nevskiaceae bacterium]|nr:DUF1631 family protein [Nevskiaceae bacterium]